MFDFSPVYSLIALLPLDCLQSRFMQQALLGLLLLTPMAAVLGVQVLNFRMAFFSDAIGHSAFAGVALGLILAVNPRLSMPLFGVLVGLAIMAVRRKSNLSADTVIGIVFSAVVAFGLAVVSRFHGVARDMQQFLYGDILTISETEITFLALLFPALMLFQAAGYNRLLQIALHPVTAKAHGVRVALWQYLFAGLLALVVMFSVRAVGVLLVTAMLIVPAATARNLARTAGGMFWWALLVGLSSGFAGLTLSAQDWLATSSGATVILAACAWFALSAALAALRGHRRN
ncbi:metal ABC transporter permease [Desulfovibrio sp. ZJ200]|uniref:metal ABC transporter permease n=1 Tax=Desulfovibrio sp. ZJ200 TaxID=2709792 RepID=UPI0013ED1738|nr:metal ABC transporter permease [Desulfovibrio sp. ZJ200]